ncbi:MAG: polysaccharide deacetylase family protein [Clostridiales bacterium]|nr:polysaccharide deacetylase family protein [Clostridiales bacterium]
MGQTTNTDKIIAITFDDGPNTEITPLVLDKLEQYHIIGSFFVIGNLINEESAKVMQRAVALGCDIHNHSWTHSFMTKLTKEEIIKEIEDTTKKIKEVTGQDAKFFRPPYIDVNDVMFESIDLPFICGQGGQDWVPTVSSKDRAKKILDHVSDGSIIMLHDFVGNMKSVVALDIIIPELQRRGYEFVTITELFKRRGIEPKAYNGVVYSNVKDAVPYLELQKQQ